jgi:hypothetical protein
LEQAEDFFAGAGVQSAGRLVRQNQGWIVDQGASDSDALLLAARQLRRLVIEPLAQPDSL